MFIWKKGTNLYVYLGESGRDAVNGSYTFAAYNGGGRGVPIGSPIVYSGSGGGGATDFRLISGPEWNNFDSLKSRIMVAAGGGGGCNYNNDGTVGGDIEAPDGSNATQTGGGAGFGVGSDGSTVSGSCGGGGGGYYGGNIGHGGSSFVSGCEGCNAIDVELSTSRSNMVHKGTPDHDSGYVFDNIVITAGNAYMPDFNNPGEIMTGSSGHGAARITLVDSENAELTGISVKNALTGDSIPLEFDVNTQTYVVELDKTVSKVVLDATSNSKDALIEGTGEFLVENNDTNVVKLTDTTGTTHEYYVTFAREVNEYRYLDDILINGVSINNFLGENVEFNPGQFSYYVTVPYNLEFVNIEAVKNNDFQSVQNEGIYAIGVDTVPVSLVVTAEDEEISAQSYFLYITREKSSKLRKLKINNSGIDDIEFSKDKYTYDLDLNSAVLSLDVEAIPYYGDASITITGHRYLEDSITINSHVDGVEDSVYTIILNRSETEEFKRIYDFTGSSQIFKATMAGFYEVQLWGAGGGAGLTNFVPTYKGGFGSYTKGTIKLQQDEELYVFVGGQGGAAGAVDKFTGGTGGWNGGAQGGNDTTRDYYAEPGGGGGGATDVRTVNGEWNGEVSLRSRIMVASGGSGGSYNTKGANGGGLLGYSPTNNYGSVASENAGYAFGYGASSINGDAGSGGTSGGWYGGYAPNNSFYSGGSATSYISGHKGSIGVNAAGEKLNAAYSTIADSYSHTGKIFTDTLMIDGAGYKWEKKKGDLELMPNTNGSYYELGHGHTGDGAASITLLSTISSDNYLDNLLVEKPNGEYLTLYHENTYETSGFEAWTQDYYVTVPNEIAELKISAITKDVNATIAGEGTFDIAPGSDDKIIYVTSSDNSVRTYKIHIERTPNDDATPNNILLEGYTSYVCNNLGDDFCNYTFNASTEDYEIKLPYSVNSITFKPVLRTEYQNVVYYYVDIDTEETIELSNHNGHFTLNPGENYISVEITAEDGIHSAVYNYTINRDATGNTNTRSINIVSPFDETGETNLDSSLYTFNRNTYEYMITYGEDYRDVSSVEFKVDTELLGAVVTANGNTCEKDGNMGTCVVQGLAKGLNDINIHITAPNGESATYLYHIFKTTNASTTLNNIVIKASDDTNISLSPVFNSMINDYVVEIPSIYKTLTITPTSTNRDATVTISGEPDFANGEIYKTGLTQVAITVSVAGEEDNVYYINIIRKKSSNANLYNIEVPGYNLDEEVTGNRTYYNVTVPKAIKKLALGTGLIITPEEETTSCTVKGNTALIANNNRITITCTAEDKTQKTYYLNVARVTSTNNDLANLRVDKGTLVQVEDTSLGFDKNVTDYKVLVDEEIDNITVTANAQEISSTVSGTGQYALDKGENTILIKVTAESGDEKTYTITVMRDYSHEGRLRELTNSQNAEVSHPKDDDNNENEYVHIINVQNSVTSITLTGYALDSNATVFGNGTYQLREGENTIRLSVKTEGNDIVIHEVKVMRDLSDNDDLEYLFVEEGALSPKFKDTTIFYDVYVPIGTTSLTIDYKTEDKAAGVSIKGNTITEEGPNTVTLTVTSASGKTKIYTINVIVQGSTDDTLRLSDLRIDNTTVTGFDSETFIYHVNVANNVTSVYLDGDASCSECVVTGEGNYNLIPGKNALSLNITNNGIIKSYQVIVEREKSNVATLNNLVVKGSVLSPTFNKNTQYYTLTTSAKSLEFTAITPTEKEAEYVIKDNEDFVIGDSNVVEIEVTAPNGTDKFSYYITVTREASNNNNLKELEVVGFDISPEFFKGIVYYTLSVTNDVNSIRVRAEAEDEAATVTGATVYNLETGENTIEVVVTSETNVDKTYTIKVYKDGNNNNYLSDLAVSDGDLNQEFDKEIRNYTVTVPYNVEAITIYGNAEALTSTVDGLGEHSLSVGTNTIEVTVTSETGADRTYTIVVNRPAYHPATLDDLVVTNYLLDEEFDTDFFEYHVTVPNEVKLKDINIVATPTDDSAVIEITKPEELVVGMNLFEVSVTTSSEENTYKVYVNRQLSTNNKLQYITVSSGTLSPKFNPDVLSYTVEVANNVTSITIDAAVDDVGASIRNTDILGSHNLSVGENNFSITVRSSMGIDRTYGVKVTRKGNDNNNLTNLQVKNGSEVLTMTPRFSNNNISYTVNVNSSVSYVTIVAEPSVDTITITGDGTKALTDDVNTFVVTVRSESGLEKPITIVVNRTKSSNAGVTGIIPSAGAFTDDFDADTLEYTLKIDNTVGTLGFTVNLEDDTATVSGNETKVVTSSEAVRTITVTSEDESVTKTYTINIEIDNIGEARLSSITIPNAEWVIPFNKDTFTYNIKVSASKEELLESEIEVVKMDERATVNMMGNITLQPEITNTYVIEVIAHDGYTSQTYTLNITRDSLDYSLKLNDDAPDAEEIKRDDIDYIIGLNAEVTVDELKTHFDNDSDMLNIYQNSVKLSGNDKIGTGMTLKLEVDNVVYDEVKIIIRGDVNGDGRIDSSDNRLLTNYIQKIVDFDECQLIAGELTKDGKIDNTDKRQLVNFSQKLVESLN